MAAERATRVWGAVAGLTVLLTTLLAGFGPPETPVTVSAAISLSDALEEVGRAYAREGGPAVRFNFAASNVLSRQIVSGAPVDVFISADEAQMDLASHAGAIDVKTRIPLLGNRLAVLTLPGGPLIPDIRALLQPAIKRIAIGDPGGVPAGGYAREYLQRAGLWDALEPRLVPLSSVRAALGAVENGSAEAAITYETDAVAAHKARAAFIVTGAAAPRIVYPAAITTGARNRVAAERVLSYLRGRSAAVIFRRYKFIPLEPGV